MSDRIYVNEYDTESVSVTFVDHVGYDTDGQPEFATSQRVVWAQYAREIVALDDGAGRGVFASDQWRGFGAAAAWAKAKMRRRFARS